MPWITTDEGNHLFIGDGGAVAGGKAAYRQASGSPAAERPSGNFTEALTAKEEGALVAYKENARVNEWLRGDRSPAAGTDAENRATVKILDSALAKSKMAENTTIYRGYGEDDLLGLLGSKGYLKEKGYVSGSLDKSIANEFGGNGYMAKIEIPAGSSAYKYPNDSQQEVLLPRNSKLTIMGINHTERVVNLRYS